MSEKSIFSKIIDREIPADIVFESERIIVIKDINPDAPVHLLGITKKPYQNVHELLKDGNQADLLWELMSTLAQVAEEQGIAESGYRLITNSGKDAHQIVPHLHVHLVGGARLQMSDPHPTHAE
jgi:histidine triad (HIT) family protein